MSLNNFRKYLRVYGEESANPFTPKYTFIFTFIILGAIGYIQTNPNQCLAEVEFFERECRFIIYVLQMITTAGETQIYKKLKFKVCIVV